MRTIFPAALALASVLSSPAHAGIDEMRWGVLAHDVGVFGGEHEQGADIDVEVLFETPTVLEPAWAPRPHVGISVNTEGDTSQAYAGLTWTWDATDWLFMDFSLGGAVHNGKLESDTNDRVSLGSRVLFRESISLGVRLGERSTVSVMLAHISNANLAENNEGMDTFGLRWGYRF